jgi:hypothetical protein
MASLREQSAVTIQRLAGDSVAHHPQFSGRQEWIGEDLRVSSGSASPIDSTQLWESLEGMYRAAAMRGDLSGTRQRYQVGEAFEFSATPPKNGHLYTDGGPVAFPIGTPPAFRVRLALPDGATAQRHLVVAVVTQESVPDERLARSAALFAGFGVGTPLMRDFVLEAPGDLGILWAARAEFVLER